MCEPDNVRLAMGIVERPEVARECAKTISPPVPLRKVRDEALAAIERKAIAEAIGYTNGNKAAAARLLEVDVKTLYTKLRQYGLES
jgi:DNA-binding NtrC family response regulator